MEYLVPPWEHQKVAIERAAKLPYFALFFEQGTGKTSTLINILRQKYKDAGRHLRTLILCPPIVIENWKREFQTYSNIPMSKIITLTGTLFTRLHRTDSHQDATYITNYQSLLMPKLYERFLNFGFDIVVLDESHKIKTHNSQTTKKVLELGKQAKFRYCLTGTPILNTVSDIFPQILFLDEGATFGKSYWVFRQTYFHDFNKGMPSHVYFPNWKMLPKAPEEIRVKIEPISMRVLKSECLDLPPLVRQRIDCGLTDEQATIYRELEKEFFAELANGYVMTDLELTKGLRLQQLVSGYIPNEKGEVYGFKNNSRIDALREMLSILSGDHKLIVWACFRQNFVDIRNACFDLKLPCVEVHGGISAAQKEEGCRLFQQDDKIRVLIGHPRSAGIGINLTKASYSIFYSRSFSLEDDLQAEARNYRGGSEQHESITRIDFVTPGTIDEVVLQALASKQSLSEAIIKHYQTKEKDPCYHQQHSLPNRITYRPCPAGGQKIPQA